MACILLPPKLSKLFTQLADIPCRNALGKFARSGKISALDHAPYGGTGATEKCFDYGLPDIC